MAKEKNGYIYVLTNESFHRDNWVKIGYAEDVDKRVKELSGTSVPLPFEVYCTYEIPRIEKVKDPDRLLHDMISKLNPDLRISPNREFFEMYPSDAYDMLFAIAQMHGRADKIFVRNNDNATDSTEINDSGYTIDRLFPDSNDEVSLFAKLKRIMFSVDPAFDIVPTSNYVAFKLDGKKNVISLWPRKKCIEVVLNAKLGTITDSYNLVYDISNRKWPSEQYAFKFYEDTNTDALKDIISQICVLKRK